MGTQQQTTFALDGAQTQHSKHQRIDASRSLTPPTEEEQRSLGRKVHRNVPGRLREHGTMWQDRNRKQGTTNAFFDYVRRVPCSTKDASSVYVRAERRKSQLWKQHGIAHTA